MSVHVIHPEAVPHIVVIGQPPPAAADGRVTVGNHMGIRQGLRALPGFAAVTEDHVQVFLLASSQVLLLHHLKSL